MATDLIQGTVKNADTVPLTYGMVVRISTNNSAVRAQADSTPHLQGLYGVVVSGSIAPLGNTVVALNAARGWMLLETGLTPSAGQTLYVSATTAGSATNVAPANAVAIGVIEDARQYAPTGRVFASIQIVTSTVSGSGLPSGTGLVKVTAGVGGLASPYVDYVPGGDWYDLEAAAMRAALPALTAVDGVKLGASPAGVGLNTTNTQDAGKEGGALAGKTSAWNRCTQATIWQNCTTSVFAMSIQCSGNTNGIYFGLIDPTSAFGVLINSQTNIAGHWALFGIGTGGSTSNVDLGAVDLLVHTWRFFSDGTTVTVYKDGAPVGTLPTSALNFPTQAASPGFNSPTSTNQAIYRCAWGYVGP